MGRTVTESARTGTPVPIEDVPWFSARKDLRPLPRSQDRGLILLRSGGAVNSATLSPYRMKGKSMKAEDLINALMIGEIARLASQTDFVDIIEYVFEGRLPRVECGGRTVRYTLVVDAAVGYVAESQIDSLLRQIWWGQIGTRDLKRLLKGSG